MLFQDGVLGNYSDLFLVEKKGSGWGKAPVYRRVDRQNFSA